MKEINIGVLGCGIVGSGVIRLLTQNKDVLSSRVGASLKLKYAADIDPKKEKELHLEKGVYTSNALQAIQDPEIDIIVETIGGKTIANDMILKSIENGKHVVTANKALLASKGNEIVRQANLKSVDLAYEASVGGCIPIIKAIRESLVGNRIRSMWGILNGTCNYILSKISDEGGTFSEALAAAQAKGFAEADPTLDIKGNDTAHKLAIINALAYGMEINYDDIYIEGITDITPMDIEFAKSFGYKIKLLAISKDKGNAIEARVHPTMVSEYNLISSVNENLNAITITTDAVGDMMLYGYGAGMMPTASAVVSDIVDISRNILSCSKRRIPILSYQPKNIRKIPVVPIDEIETNYYIRFSALDRPGVLSKISGVLGEQSISIQSVHQKGRKTSGAVPIVMLTHRAKEASVKMALAQIAKLNIVPDRPVLIRIEDEGRLDE